MIQIHGTKVQISREGIASVWDQYYVAEEINIDDVPTTRKGVGGGGSLQLVEISSGQAEEGQQHIVTAKYEGLAAPRFVNPTYAWEPEIEQSAIVLNPNWPELARRYQGKWDKELSAIEWPEKLSSGKKEIENPLLGTQSYLDLMGQWSETRAETAIDPAILADMWTLVESVPGDFPTPKNRLWFTMPPQITQRGACFEVRRIWRLTGIMTQERLEATRLIYRAVT